VNDQTKAAILPRTVAWFSHGAASAIATKMALAKHGPETVIACIDTGSEHDDNVRFLHDCERWFQHEIIVLRSTEYVDVDDVIERTRYINGPTGARCTAELKKKVRYAFERPDDLHVWGYTADTRDAKRATRFTEQNPGMTNWYPLVEAGLTKSDCLALLERAGIALPEMYELGYVNNNCIGCVKGGMGYWNKIRVDFPEVFARRAQQERDINHTILRQQVPDGPKVWVPPQEPDPDALFDDGGEGHWHQPMKSVPLWLDELEPGRGRYEAEDISCGPACEIVATDIETPVTLTTKEAAA
jgi:3'-phosphoadenosine 5'-phosphosulfate sulfotransferase (PAPS reductase)/FAD synthetase